MWLLRRLTERIFLLLITGLLTFLFIRLDSVIQQEFADVAVRLEEGSMVNLNGDKPAEKIAKLLKTGYYFNDPKDISLAERKLQEQLQPDADDIENIGALNKRQFNIPVDSALVHGGTSYRRRAQLSKILIGFSGEDSSRYEQEKENPPVLPSSVSLDLGSNKVTGEVYANEDPLEGILVRLDLQVAGSMGPEVPPGTSPTIWRSPTLVKRFLRDTLDQPLLQSMSAYVRTDASGHFAFIGLPSSYIVSITPLQPGFHFGGIRSIRSSKNEYLSFSRRPHEIKLLATRDLNHLKKDRAIIVRSPEYFEKWLLTIALCFVGGFLLLHLLLTVRFPSADQFILPVLMLLMGLSVLTLVSLQDPLRDWFLAQSTLQYFGVGIGCILILLLFDLRRFTIDSGLFRMFAFQRTPGAANGWPWAALAILLLLLTIVFGTGPEGSGVKVNLFGFVPSEIVKFILVLFLAGFFSVNETFIAEYRKWQTRWTFFSFAVVAISIAIVLFLLLNDLGPAMVLCFTFIVLFSFSRGDFLMAVATATVYVALIWILKNIWLSTAIVGAGLAIAGFGKRGVSESSIMVLFVMAVFLLIDKIPFLHDLFPSPLDRLAARKAIWENPWNNSVYGGDHIANSIWGMASGGITGQGIGEGFAKTIPEAHTDMILPSMGEELGWASILSVFILFLLYLHRSTIIGRETGRPFLFYLCAGIGISTFVQFLLIAGGSVGALPLSGISFPFMSYGGTSLILNMIAAGFLISASNVRGTLVQMKYVAQRHDRNLVPALVAAVVAVVMLGVNVSAYLFNNKKWIVEPAIVADRSGNRIFSYNPRISILMDRLGAGNLLDRRGQLLATGNPQTLVAHSDSLTSAGIKPKDLVDLSRRRLSRYYPFAEHMFFWIGDLNTGIFMGATNGYYAEYQHIAELRGFSTPPVPYIIDAKRENDEQEQMVVMGKDYSALSPLLLAGIRSQQVDSFRRRNRDVQLTMDAALQMEMQRSLQTADSLNKYRISVVVIDDHAGDVIASAVYPLPTIDDWEKLTLTRSEQNKLPYWITNYDLGFVHATQPGSTAKLVTAIAAFNKLGTSAAKKVIQIRPADLIRTRSDEPDEAGNISIERAIVRSNNPFFIRLANQEDLEEEMASLYTKSGMFLRGVGGYYYQGDFDNESLQERWLELWRETEFRSVRTYDPNNIRRTRARGVSGMAWGQGELIASPAAIARVASAIANNGTMMPSRYVIRISDSLLPPKPGVPMMQAIAASTLTGYMRKASAPKYSKLGMSVAGKTGTPERISRGERINDGWYVFFAPKLSGEGHIVTCIRIENCKGSSVAVNLAGSNIIPLLKKHGYIRSFGSDNPPGTAILKQR